MALTFHPKAGQILMCDFSGFEVPEIVKVRPVLVITPPHKGGSKLVTVVPLSTRAPDPVMPYHFRLPKQCLPRTAFFHGKESWLKGDMVYTVGFHRLDLIKLGGRNPATGKREYYRNKLGRDHMAEIYKCVLHGLNMGHLVKHF